MDPLLLIPQTVVHCSLFCNGAVTPSGSVRIIRDRLCYHITLNRVISGEGRWCLVWPTSMTPGPVSYQGFCQVGQGAQDKN